MNNTLSAMLSLIPILSLEDLRSLRAAIDARGKALLATPAEAVAETPPAKKARKVKARKSDPAPVAKAVADAKATMAVKDPPAPYAASIPQTFCVVFDYVKELSTRSFVKGRDVYVWRSLFLACKAAPDPATAWTSLAGIVKAEALAKLASEILAIA